MIIIKNKKLTILYNNFISIGYSKGKEVIGICLFDKYCYTNIFGFGII